MAYDPLDTLRLRTVAGMRIVVNNYLPKKTVGHEIIELQAHWFVAWILGLFGKSDHVMWLKGQPIEVEDALIDHRAGVIYCSPAMYREIYEQVAIDGRR